MAKPRLKGGIEQETAPVARKLRTLALTVTDLGRLIQRSISLLNALEVLNAKARLAPEPRNPEKGSQPSRQENLSRGGSIGQCAWERTSIAARAARQTRKRRRGASYNTPAKSGEIDNLDASRRVITGGSCGAQNLREFGRDTLRGWLG